MGNHFRTPGDEPATPQVSPSAASAPAHAALSPEVQDRLFEQPVPQPSSAVFGSDAFASDAQPAQHAAANPLFNVPSPDAPAAAPVSVPSPMDAPAPMPEVTPDQAEEVADLNAALANPDFTTVFAPVEDSRAQQAREAGVEPVILMEHVTKIYPAQPNKPALDDINLEIYPGEFVFLVGHSGSGKTTLLNTMLRNVKPTSGRVMVAGQDLMKIKNRKIPFLRRQIGAVFQDYKLLPNRTAYENVAFALQCIGKPKAVIKAQVPEVLRLVGLAEQMDSLPDQLSGGEQQRVSVARAMVNRPPLLICDEPTGNLDPAISLGIMKLLERINRTGTTVIVATHDREMVDSMHRRVIALEGGRVIRDQERGGYGNYGVL
ncbi:MAG: cell division ATP-binding protein FtsE [Coriobacteriaceae bacterium]|nr:cell division ATP-binding protein FtsE [Coriobacteriaceae bacterium]